MDDSAQPIYSFPLDPSLNPSVMRPSLLSALLAVGLLTLFQLFSHLMTVLDCVDLRVLNQCCWTHFEEGVNMFLFCYL